MFANHTPSSGLFLGHYVHYEYRLLISNTRNVQENVNFICIFPNHRYWYVPLRFYITEQGLYHIYKLLYTLQQHA